LVVVVVAITNRTEISFLLIINARPKSKRSSVLFNTYLYQQSDTTKEQRLCQLLLLAGSEKANLAPLGPLIFFVNTLLSHKQSRKEARMAKATIHHSKQVKRHSRDNTPSQ
jgi:hypothetical protein